MAVTFQEILSALSRLEAGDPLGLANLSENEGTVREVFARTYARLSQEMDSQSVSSHDREVALFGMITRLSLESKLQAEQLGHHKDDAGQMAASYLSGLRLPRGGRDVA